MWLGDQQIRLGTRRAGQVVRFWVDCDWIHLPIGGWQVKSVRTQLTVADSDKLVARRAVAAGPPPQASTRPPPLGIVEVERTISRGGTISLGSRVVLAAWILGGRLEPAQAPRFGCRSRCRV
jgi:hypothetical protein